MNIEWEKEFEDWMQLHDSLLGGLDSSQIEPLKSFIQSLLASERAKIVNEIRNHAKYKSVEALANQGCAFAIAGDDLEKLLKSLTPDNTLNV